VFVPSSINLWWNQRSRLGLVLRFQILTRVILTMHFRQSFDALIFYMRNTDFRSNLRFCHRNRASFFLFFMFLHLFRGIYYYRYNKTKLWISGCTILLLRIGSAFLRYVLPYRQISYWRATVIINLASIVPFIGPLLCIAIWRSYTVSTYTLKRFFTFHFLLPLILTVLVIGHTLLLHMTRSNRSVNIRVDKKYFVPIFVIKDICTWTFYRVVRAILMLVLINVLRDVENYLSANPLVTPLHIKPEWYFLFAYAILRCIPSKVVRVLALVLSVLFPIIYAIFRKSRTNSSNIGVFILSFFILTVTRRMPVEDPYVLISQITSVTYFISYFI